MASEQYVGKYPYFDSAREAVEDSNFSEALTDSTVLKRAVERILFGIDGGQTSKFNDTGPSVADYPDGNKTAELQSYAIARLLVSLLSDYRVVNQYVSAESATGRMRMKADFSQDDENADLTYFSSEKISLDDALDEFDLIAEPVPDEQLIKNTSTFEYYSTLDEDGRYEFLVETFGHLDRDVLDSADSLVEEIIWALNQKRPERNEDTTYRVPVSDYAQVASEQSSEEWHLTNRDVHDGEVTLTETELLDMFEVLIAERVGADLPYDVNEEIASTLRGVTPFEDIEAPDWWTDSSGEKLPTTESEFEEWDDKDREYDFIELLSEAIDDEHFSYEIDRVEPGLFPPVIDHLLERWRAGENLMHEARLTVATFLINIGMTDDEVVETVGAAGERWEEPTRYQVEHLRDGGGDGEPYTPPTYDTIRAWGIDWEPDSLEQSVKHPLTYYKVKLKDENEDDDDDGDDNEEHSKEDIEEVEPKSVADADIDIDADDFE